MSTPPKDSDIRTKLLAKIVEALALEAEGKSEEISGVASQIEDAIQDKYKGKDYTTRGRSIVFNLNKNIQLRRRVLNGMVTPIWLASASVTDLATDTLKMQRQESADRYQAMRSLGNSDEHVVGWNAGTTGKLGWSHKYENEPKTALSNPAGLDASLPHAVEEGDGADDEGAGNADEDAEEKPTEAAEATAGADAEGELEEDSGMNDEELDDLKAPETSTALFSEADDDDGDDNDEDDDGYVPMPVKSSQGSVLSPGRGIKRPRSFGASSEGGDATNGQTQPVIHLAEYTHALVRHASLQEAVASCGVDLGPDEGSIRQRVSVAVEKARTVAAQCQ